MFVIKLLTKKYEMKFLLDEFLGYLLGLKVRQNFFFQFEGRRKIGLYKDWYELELKRL